MDAAARAALLRELEAEERRHDGEAMKHEIALLQPLASLVTGGYACEVLADGTEVFRNEDVEVRVPPSCVRRLRPTPPAPAVPAQRAALLAELRRAAAGAPGVS